MILVTGATGFVGSELIRQLLLLGEPVCALKRETSSIPHFLQNVKTIRWITADILDYFALEEALKGVDKVYHCAAFISFNAADKKKMLQFNVQGTANIVNICNDKNVGKLLHVSSVAAIGESKPGELITEGNQWEFNGHQSGYAVSKYQSEMEVWRGIAEGLNAVIINPSIIIGKEAGITGSGRLFEAVRKGLNYYTNGSCGLVAVEDVAKSMIALMESDIAAERYIINAENWNFRDLVTETANKFGLKPPAKEAKPWMLNLALTGTQVAGAITGKNYGLTKDIIRSAFTKQDYSNEKIKKTIGIQFKPIKETIHEIVNH